jgi:hypothetical protein
MEATIPLRSILWVPQQTIGDYCFGFGDDVLDPQELRAQTVYLLNALRHESRTVIPNE